MKSIRNRLTVGLVAGSIATAGGVVVTGLGHAQAPAAPEPTGRHEMRGPHGGDGMHGFRSKGMMRGVERLKTELRLDPSQAALWDLAVAQMRPPAGGREEMKVRRDRMKAMLDDPAFDPRSLVADMDRQDTERRSRMSATRDAWLRVWDSLDATQRGQIREFLRTRMGRR